MHFQLPIRVLSLHPSDALSWISGISSVALNGWIAGVVSRKWHNVHHVFNYLVSKQFKFMLPSHNRGWRDYDVSSLRIFSRASFWVSIHPLSFAMEFMVCFFVVGRSHRVILDLVISASGL